MRGSQNRGGRFPGRSRDPANSFLHGRGQNQNRSRGSGRWSNDSDAHQARDKLQKKMNSKCFVSNDKYSHFFQLLNDADEKGLANVIRRCYDQWIACWKDSGTLPPQASRHLVITLAKLPFSADIKPPPISFCATATKNIFSANHSTTPEEVSRNVEIALNFTKRLTKFRWDEEKQTVKRELEDILDCACSVLSTRIADQRNLQMQIIAFMDELSKPWTILMTEEIFQPELESLDFGGTETPNLLQWKQPNIGWLSDGKHFLPPNLPVMKVPRGKANGVYDSVEEYFETVIRIWIGLTFGEGHNSLSPSCKIRNAGKECGHILWPVSNAENVKCHSHHCHNNAVLACCNKNHDYGFCEACVKKIREGFRGPPGPGASTHIYDGAVAHMSYDNVVYIENIESRKPPQNPIHWRTTKRLASPNIVGIVKVSNRCASLHLNQRIIWGEIVNHKTTDPNQREELFRERKQLAVSLLNLFENVGDIDVLARGDFVVVIDCQTFSPEFIPVLKAMETQRKVNVPFNNGQQLNLSRSVSPVSYPTVFEGIEKNFSNDMEWMVDNSLLDPIIQIRRDERARLILIDLLRRLMIKSNFDEAQRKSFISALLHPVHCTQGPPGTGKSYLGVVITQAFLLIQHMWKRVSPSIGSPPILVLSYKNHAIDEFLLDLVHAEPRHLDLIRIGGGCNEPELFQYSERNLSSREQSVVAPRKKLEQIYGILQCFKDASDDHTKLLLFYSNLPDESESEKNMRSYEAAYVFRNMLNRILFLLDCNENMPWKSNKGFTFTSKNGFEELPKLDFRTAVKAFEMLVKKEENLSSDKRLQHNLIHLYESMRHYNKSPSVPEILWLFLTGFVPRSQCSYSDKNGNQCREISQPNFSFCWTHQCNFVIEDHRCENVVSSKRFCEQHACQSRGCFLPKLPFPQLYCSDHACFVCLERGAVAEMSADDPPRNTCTEHPLCAFGIGVSSCKNIAGQDSPYCELHYQTCCQGKTSKGKPCKSSAIMSRDCPFCKDHQNQFVKTRPSTASTDFKGTLSSSCQAKTNKGKRCKNKPIPLMQYCQVHLGKYSAVAPVQTNILDSNTEKTRVSFGGSIDIPFKEIVTGVEAPTSPTQDDPDKTVILPVEDQNYEDDNNDEDDFYDPDNIDEVEESDHLQHIREVFEIEENFDEIFLDASEDIENDNFQESNENIMTWTPISDWKWSMSAEERRCLCQQVVDIDSFFVSWLQHNLKYHAAQSQREYHDAKVKASAYVYEGKEIIAGTIVGCISRLEAIRSTNPFAIVIEEASEVMEPLLFACICPTTCKLEMIGDHLQLQPSTMNKFDYERINRINVSLFERLICAPRTNPVPSDVLSVQRRMRTNICDFTREFYEDITDIEDHEKCHTRRIGEAQLGTYRYTTATALNSLPREVPGMCTHIFFWTHQGKQECAQVGLSKINRQEADMVCQLARYLVTCGVPKSSIAILTPYKGQLMLIRKDLMSGRDPLIISTSKDKNSRRTKAQSCILSTVDRFQGDEADVVIASLVIDSNSRTPFVKLQNRMVVLLSRARLGMFIVGNVGYFENKPAEHWKLTIDRLHVPEQDDSIPRKESQFAGARVGPKLPICCSIHQTMSIKEVLRPDQLKLGFCQEKCTTELSCSHNCGLLCHWPNPKHNLHCKVELECPCLKHPGKIECHVLMSSLKKITGGGYPFSVNLPLESALKRYRCDKTVDVMLPCTHQITLQCCEETDISSEKVPWPICAETAFEPFVYPVCKHTLLCKCNQLQTFQKNPSLVPPCDALVEFIPSCGHNIKIKCYLKQQHESGKMSFICPEKVAVTLPRCGHKQQVACKEAVPLLSWSGVSCQGLLVEEGKSYGPKDYLCNEKIRFRRACGHEEKLPCEQAFEYAKNPQKCKELVEILTPICGHVVVVPCHEKLVLDAIKRKDGAVRCVVEACSQKSFLEPPPGFSSNCKELVLVKRTCGHEEKMKCKDAQHTNLPSCQVRVTISNPLCGHETIMPCGLKHQWNPWTVHVQQSSWYQLLMQVGVLEEEAQSQIAGPLSPPSNLKHLVGKCDSLLTLRRTDSCGHELQGKCSELFEWVFNRDSKRYKPPKCDVLILQQLDCGHTKQFKCSEYQAFLEKRSDCNEHVQRRCWNFLVCGQTLITRCSDKSSVCCNTYKEWICEANLHMHTIPLCRKGVPNHCPECSVSEISGAIRKLEVLLDAENTSQCTLDACLSKESFKVQQELVHLLNALGQRFISLESKPGIDAFLNAKVRLLSTFYEWATKQDSWERPLFDPQMIPCFIVLDDKQAKDKKLNSFCPGRFKKVKTLCGIEVKKWSLTNLRKLASQHQRTKNIHLLFGFGYLCHTLVNPRSIPKKFNVLDKWCVQKHQQWCFDSVQEVSDHEDKFTFWEPFCLIATSKISLSSQFLFRFIDHWENTGENSEQPVRYDPKFITYQFPEGFVMATSDIDQGTCDPQALHLYYSASDLLQRLECFEGYFVALSQEPWDEQSLGLSKSLEQELKRKLWFQGMSGGLGTDPFSGVKTLTNLQKSAKTNPKRFSLFLCLEFLHLGKSYISDAEKELKNYAQSIQDAAQGCHPLTLLAVARLLFYKGSSNDDALQCVLIFSQLYPTATTWLKPQEIEMKKRGTDTKVKDVTIGVSSQEQWQALLSKNPSCASPAMEKLLKLTGLERLKLAVIQFFKTAMAYKKMNAEDKKNNSVTMNFAFLGNPGSGKTTVARLFAQLLVDAGMRKKSEIVECTAQELKDGGIDEFRKKIKEAMNGVLFIDEAYDLDPSGDFKGKPIVSELLTVAENQRGQLSIIIAGYEDDMNKKLFSFNDGLRSRFQELVFDDYDEQDLKCIWEEMLVGKKWQVEDNNLSTVVAKRLAVGANKKGFGNARAVRSFFERAIQKAFSREDYSGETVLKVCDVMGENPFENQKLKRLLQELEQMIGWHAVKKSIKELTDLSQKNYERELSCMAPLPVFMNRLFLGNPGTGKTTCAAIYGQVLKHLNFLSNGEVVIKTANDFIGSFVGESSKKTIEILNSAKGKVLVIDEAYNLNDSMYGKQVLDVLVEKIQGTPADDIAVLLLGYEEQMLDMLRTQNPGLARRFPKEFAFVFHDYSDSELLEIFNEACEKQNVSVASYLVSEKAIKVLSRQRACPNFGNAASVKLLVNNAIAKAAARAGTHTIQLELDDIESGIISSNDPFAPLNKMYNVENIKAIIQQLYDTFKVANDEGGVVPEVGHFVFRGSPGTGKTTVARVMADILFQLEMIATNRIVETSGLELTGEFIGQTKKKVAEKLGQAKGSILFIDEAYELGKGMYGEEAMTTLLAAMTSLEYKGLVIIIAGYAGDIDEMLDRNVGLKSRFTQYFDFQDWLPTDATHFFLNLAECENFIIPSSEVHKINEFLDSKFEDLRKLPGWANARDVKQLWKNTFKFRSTRVVNSPEDVKTVCLLDVRQAFDEMILSREKPKAIRSHSTNYHMDTRVQESFPPTCQKERFVCQEDEVKTLSSEEQEDDCEQMIVKLLPRFGFRDSGVSDEDWEELEAAKQAYYEKLEKMKREKEKAELEAALKEELRKAAAVQEKIRQIQPCPAGFAWTKVGNGWRCGGGSHFVSDKQLETHFSG